MGRVTLDGELSAAGGMDVELTTERGRRVSSDAGPPNGADRAARPTELVLAGLLACTSMDVISILRKKRQQASRYRLRAEADTADGPPAVFHRVVVEHLVEGDVEAEALRRSIELSATRYCPVVRMLSRAVEIEHRYRLRRPGEDEVEALVAVTAPEGDRVS